MTKRFLRTPIPFHHLCEIEWAEMGLLPPGAKLYEVRMDIVLGGPQGNFALAVTIAVLALLVVLAVYGRPGIPHAINARSRNAYITLFVTLRRYL
ncbi:MAG TPA: hypothetical protein VFB60_22655 [Ktedonobacteraceae bacterium]|nr:hypothetical protein [Ktedonobacteraceae bacterium]